MSDDVKYVIGIIVVIILTIVGVMALLNSADRSWQKSCGVLSEQTGRQTVYRETCFIEIAPGMFVNEKELAYYLDFVEPVRVKEPKE